jgi:hypothetical protein
MYKVVLMDLFNNLSTEDKINFLNDMQDIMFKQGKLEEFNLIKINNVKEF